LELPWPIAERIRQYRHGVIAADGDRPHPSAASRPAGRIALGHQAEIGELATREGAVQAGFAVAGLLFLGLLPAAHSAEPEQCFTSIFWDDKKIGQVHVRLIRGETGEIEELRARASVSMLGIDL
jgi:hypothetical protein